MAREYRLISSDGHLEVRPERWTHRVPAKYRDRAPRSVQLPDGGDAILIEGQPLQEANFLDLRAGRAEGQWQPFGIKVEEAAGTGSPEQRVREQDLDGLDAEVLFTAMVAGPVLWRNIAHDEVYKTVIRAYNDWLAEEYCAVAPDRLIGLGVIPWTNVDDAIAEMEHCAKQGLKGVVLGVLPSAKGYPTPEDDRFWAIAEEAEKGYGMLVIGLKNTTVRGHKFSPGVTQLAAGFEGPLAIVEARDGHIEDPPDARLSIEVLTDPDYGEGEQLFLGVSTSLSEAEALEALRRFDREWWVHHVPRTGGRLCIDLGDE